MRKKTLKTLVLYGIIILAIACNQEKPKSVEIGEPIDLDINTTSIAKIQPTMYGIFYEDINFAADGGLYAELIKNGSFEFPDPKMGWEETNSLKYSLNKNSGFGNITNYIKDQNNKRFSHFVVHQADNYQIINEGFRGIGVKEGEKYDLSLKMAHAKGIDKVHFNLIDSLDNTLASVSFVPDSEDWKTYEAVLEPNKTNAKAKLKLTFEGKGSVDIDRVSLFPQETWKGRKKGLRKDLVQLLDDMDPGFLRFPGGCIVEGRTLAQRYQWKKTVGTLDQRELLINRWNDEFAHRPTPDYYQSFGLGFFEYFQLSEDMGAEPLPILGCGMACQFNTGELVPLGELDPYVQDALDLIEFANGGLDTQWGSVRNDMGHPEPFNMKYLGIGNEQWGPEYFDRYKIFADIISEKYPNIVLVSTPGPFPEGDMFDYGWEQVRKLNVPIVDEHYYQNPKWFLENADRYDSYDRNGPKVFAGEYAAQSVQTVSPENKNNWECALAEAAFMTGLERNADLVHLTSYAPLMAHEEGWQWKPDLIWFNNLESFGSANYYVQRLFSNHSGTDLISITQGGKPLIGQNGIYASAVKDLESNELIIKLVNTKDVTKNVDLNMGLKDLTKIGEVVLLTSPNLTDENSFEHPKNISPVLKEVNVEEGVVNYGMPPYSVSVLKIKM
ncbi:alpha-N-arabinofuranosidase [Saonia flava]|uniref:non-reducing end alpha-L-arabinofuranosidase n=1 Tax=Saonia flava TaxID=523696 RepID=A0A846QZP3_9FLAO|nr:alpha-L-arabinofuranosidase C-terminal domain-containing protein [Saonia flava]NJB72132.1 alpha-N-arabinofuranosidase [Saonia flava]